MLSSDQLSQLHQLKQNIRASKDIARGVVRGTSSRYGFVTLEDNRDIFLSPDQMERVLPGDHVEVEITKNDAGKFEGKLEKLISSDVTFLCGQYRVRGKGHFIVTEDKQCNRWIFIPPKSRGKTKEGDFITAKLTQHPYKNGRAQASITQLIGNKDTPHIERMYNIAKFQLYCNFNKETIGEAARLSQSHINHEGLEQLHHIPFVTIDSAGTRDMDDALAIDRIDDGWLLHVAIAAPALEIGGTSPVDRAARLRTQSVYFADQVLPMMPEVLATGRYSLKPNEERLALVLRCHISPEGKTSHIQFIPAMITSQAKLSYTQVAALLNNKPYIAPEHLSDAEPHKESLVQLQQCSHALNEYRKNHFIVNSNRSDFSLIVDERGKLKRIEKIERNCAHAIVEECMLLTNHCAGDLLAKHKAGIFTYHKGFREERRNDIEKLLSEKTNSTISNTTDLQEYINTIHTLQQEPQFQPLLAIQQRFLEASKLDNQPKPHFGLGFSHYATITSPIRRYQDLYNQRTICRILTDQSVTVLPEEQLEQLKININNGRDAVTQTNQQLISDFIKDKVGQTYQASVSLLTNQGIGIRLCDTGIEGFVPATKDDKISFNNQRMELLWNEQEVQLDQEIEVTLDSIDTVRNKPVFTRSIR